MTTYSSHDGPSVAALLPALVDLYAVVYAEPPYQEGPEQVARFRDSLPDETNRPGFALTAAHDGAQLIAAAYGWTMPAGTWWSRADRPAPADVGGRDKFAVMEWIVRPDRRGEGIGADVIRRLLRDRPEPYATLASDPRSAARKMYERAGWHQVAQTTLSWGPAMDLLVIDTSSARPRGG